MSEDEAVCRMCHGESEPPERPLYFPCKCSGSIRYVHQDCLLRWLKTKANNISNSKCELCGESYKFRKIYALTGSEPPKLSVIEFLQAIVPFAKKTIIVTLQVLHVVTLYAICLPIIAACCSDICSCLLRDKPILSPLPSPHSPTQLLSSWLRGVGLIVFMSVLTLTAERCVDFILNELRKLRLEVLHERLETLQDRLRQAETRTVNREPIVAATTTTAAANIPTEVIPPGSTSTAGEDENDYVVFPDGEALDHSLFEESEDEIDIETKSGEHEEAVFNESAGVKAGSLSSAQLSHAVEQIELMKRFIEIRREPSAAARAELTEALRPLERRVMMNESDQNLRFQMNHIRDVSPDRSIPVSDNSVDIDELVEQELIQNMESAWRDCGSDVSLDSDSGSDSSSNSDDEEYLKRSEAKSIKKLKKGLVNKWHASLMEEYDRSMEGVAVSQSESEQSMNMLSMLGDLIDHELVDDKNKDESKDEGNVEEMKIDSMLDAAVSNEETHSNISNYDQINSESIIESSEINETIVDVAVEPRPAVNDPFPVGIRRRRISHRFPQPNRAIENAQIGATNVNPLVLRPDGLNQIDAVQHEGNLVPAADNIAPVMNNQPEGERNDGFFSDLTSWFFLVVAYVIVFQITYDALPVLLGRAVLTVLQMRGSLTAFMSDVAKVAHFNAGNLTKLIVTSALYLSGDLSTGDNSSIPDIDFPSSSSASGIYNSDIVPSSSSSILSDIFSNPALELQHGTWLLDQLDLLVNNDTNIQDESILLVYVESLVGFCVIAFIVVLALICYFFFYVRSASAMKRYIYTQFAMASQYTSITIKGAGLAYIELGLTPKLIGFLLSIATIKVFQTTFEDRFDICYDLPILCGCVVWAVGVMLMFHFSIVLMSLHSLLREEVIYGVIPGARDYDAMIETVIGFYDNKSIWEHMKRIFISISLNLFLFVCIVFIPLHFGHILFPLSGLNPLKFRVASKSSGTELERSVELLVSHMLLPFLIERSQGDALDTLFRAILGVGGRMFKVGYLLNPHAFPFARVVPPQDTNNILHVRVLQLNAAVDNEIATADTNSIDAGVATDLSPDQQPQVTAANSTLTATASSDSSSIPIMMSQPIRQRAIIDMEKFSIEFRTCAFVLTVLICLSIAYSATLHITLMTGRFLVSFIDAKADHDANNLCVGVAACCGLIYACSFIARDFRSIELWNSIKTVFNKWGRIAVKLSIVSIFGLSLPPLLVGILNEAILLNPLTVAHDETPSFPLFRSWALGVIILKGWIKFSMMGLLGENEWKRRWQKFFDQGVTNIDLHFVFLDILSPLMVMCLDHLLVPYFLSRTICFYIQSYEMQTIVTRYSFLIYFLIFKLFDSVKAAFNYFRGFYNQVRDSRYLIGTELTNR